MLGKLAIRNARRSMKDYSIYLITVTIAFSLIYAFNMIIYSEDIMMLSDMMKSFAYAVITVSVIVVLTMGWLVNYMIRFMLQKRSKEFGTYMVLGISNQSISKLFLIENLLLGCFSLIFGIIIGSCLYQVFTVVIMNIFKAQYEMKITFSLKALLLTFVYAIIIYLFSLLRNKRNLRKMKIYDLLYADKKNETISQKRNKSNYVVFIVSMIIGMIGLKLLRYTFSDGNYVSGNIIMLSFVCIIFCLYGCYISFSSLLVKLFLNNKIYKYKKDHMFLYRSLSAKINTMSITLGTLAMLLALTLTAVQIGMLFKGFFDLLGDAMTPFDIMISLDVEEEKFTDSLNYIEEKVKIKEKKIYQIYENGTADIYNILYDTPLGGAYIDSDIIMKYSDYVELRKMLGYKPVNLGESRFLIHCIPGAPQYFNFDENFYIQLNNEKLFFQTYKTEDFSQEGMNGAYYILVVPDKVVTGMEPYSNILAINTVEETTPDMYEDLCRIISPVDSEDEDFYMRLGNVDVKGAILSENRSAFTILAFTLFYLALIFTCVAATILAVQQLSDSYKYKFRYSILSKLGMEKREIDWLIFKQLLIYFFLPLLLPVPISISASTSVNQILRAYAKDKVLMQSMGLSFALFGSVYLLYFAATFLGYRKNVNGVR